MQLSPRPPRWPKSETDKIELTDDETETEYTDSEISILSGSDSEFEPEQCDVKHCISVADHECNMCNMALCTKHSKTKKYGMQRRCKDGN